jgi:type II secretory pathway component GspD/PulD (secretin)
MNSSWLNIKQRWLVLLFLLVSSAGIFAQDTGLAVITLSHRSADELIPVIKPLLADQGTVTGLDNQIIVKTTKENLQQIKDILAKLDRPLTRLMITLKFSSEDEQSLGSTELSGNIHYKQQADAKLPASEEKPITKNESDVRVRVYRTQSGDEQLNTQRLQTLEGHWAVFETGQSVPVTEPFIYQSPTETTIYGKTHYKDVTTGFRVLPRINGDNVSLVVEPYQQKFNSVDQTKIDQFGARTTVAGRIGQWIEIGGTGDQRKDQNVRIYATKKRGQAAQKMFIKVEVVPN